MRIFVANRGEIAVRIMRTSQALGHETVAAYADPDRDAVHVRLAGTAVRLGPGDVALSYLSVDAVLDAAQRAGANAVHPGYGFLSERADLARRVEAAGLIWIGPRAEVIEQMGSKIEARRLAKAAGLPIIPGFDAAQDDAALLDAAAVIGFPVLVKASAGGGGKGIRIAQSARDLPGALAQARAEALRSFGDDAVIVERFISRPRHVEVQLAGDRHGNIVDLGTRECSVQRHYQKVLEEAPAPNLAVEVEAALRAWAVALGKSIEYDSLGTVEFVVDDHTGEAFFLEMNTRLQVEHPVTEAVTGLDLVDLQIRIAEGERAPFPLEGPVIRGHAFEARINAEDPARGYVPQAGTVWALDIPPGVRWDAGIDVGSVVTPRYDSMLGKLIAHGPDRDAARRRLLAAVDEMLLAGVRTNTALHHWLLHQQPVIEGRVTTRFLDETELPDEDEGAMASNLAAIGWLAAREQANMSAPDVWHRIGLRRLTPHVGTRTVRLKDSYGKRLDVAVEGIRAEYRLAEGQIFRDARWEGKRLRWTSGGVDRQVIGEVDLLSRRLAVVVGGSTFSFALESRRERYADAASSATSELGVDLLAPFPAMVAEILVCPGQAVSTGQPLVVVEAMKMLHYLPATGAGVVAAVTVQAGVQVGTGDLLVRLEETPE